MQAGHDVANFEVLEKPRRTRFGRTAKHDGKHRGLWLR